MSRVRLKRACCGLVASLALLGAPAISAQPENETAFSVVSTANTITVRLHPTQAKGVYALRLFSDRNAPVARFSDVSPLQPATWRVARRLGRESWFPVIDFAVASSMEGIAELAEIPERAQVAWNGWVRRERRPAEPVFRVPSEQLLQWENTLWLEGEGARLAQFYVRLPLNEPSVTVRLLAPNWSGRIDLVAREGAGGEKVVATQRIGAAPSETRPPRTTGKALERARLRGALAEAVEHTLNSRVVDPHDPMRGGLYVFYDLDARTYRTSHWVWAWGPSVGLLLAARSQPELAGRFEPDRLLAAARDIGEASLRTVPHATGHPARDIPISRWDRGPGFDFGHELAITPCDGGFLAAWAWVRLDEATGEAKWRQASEKLAAAIGRLMTEFPIPPQNYWPDRGRWDEKVIDEAGFGVELFAELYRAHGDARMRDLGRRYMEQHIAAMGRPDGLWDRAHFLDGRPNTPTIRMTRGLGWPMEGLLAAHRLLPEEGRYLELASRMADHLLAAQKPEGWWVHRFDQPVEMSGVGMKGTALWCWLFYELHRHTGEARHLAAARRALAWLLDEQYFGDDAHARGGLVAVSPHSAVGYRRWFRVTSTYGAAFFGLAILEELKLQESPAVSGRPLPGSPFP